MGFAYDLRNRMTGVTIRASSGGAIVHRATYTYDSRDRRIGVELDGARTWTVYDGMHTYADFDGSGTLATRYLHGPAIDALLARTSSAGVTAWYLTDRLGSVRDLANTSGTVIDHVSYDSFGNILGESNPSAGDRFKFTAREFDQLTLLYHSYAGFYDPAVGGSVGLSRESPASGHRVIDPERVIAVHLNAVGILQTRQGDRSPRLKNIFSPPLFPDGPSSPHPDSYPDKIFEPAKPIKGATWPRGDELRDPTVFPYIHGQRVRLQRLSEEDYKERGFVIWKNLSKGHENRYVLTYTQIGSDFRINFNTAPKPKQTGNWKAAGTFHTHPSTGAGNPADSPLDPKNSNRTWGTKQPPVPWLIGDPLGTVWLIGPDYRGGSPNETSR